MTVATLELPGTRAGESSMEWPVRSVSAVTVGRRTRRSPAGLDALFRGDEVLRMRLGSANWFFGRTAAWTRHVIGSHQMWADLDILPLGLRTDPTFYAMGGLPGAPPATHADIRKLALASGFRRRGIAQEAIDDARQIALALALDPSDRRLDLRMFARVLCLRANASLVCGITLQPDEIVQVLRWFDRWSAIISRQLAVIALPVVAFGPARRLRGVLRAWYEFLRAAIERAEDGQEGLAGALRERLLAGDIAGEEAAGYLATILFAGTEPPAQTLLWGYTQAIASGHRWAGTSPERAEALLWEAFRVQPAVNYLIRRVSAGERRYESASHDVFVVAPPLTHRHTNAERGLPAGFTPERPAGGRLDPYAYPGLGTGAHYCIGAKLGMALTRDALAFLFNEADARGPWDVAPAGRVMARPRRLPTAILR